MFEILASIVFSAVGLLPVEVSEKTYIISFICECFYHLTAVCERRYYYDRKPIADL